MQNKLLLWLLLLVGVVAYGQNKVEFTYDTSGNRVSRQIVPLNKSAFLSDTIAISEEKMGEKTFKLYPNPTYGVLTMSISHLNDGEAIKIRVADMNGRTIMNEVQNTSNFQIDLTAHPKGFYILSAIIGTERKEWKIIKE